MRMDTGGAEGRRVRGVPRGPSERRGSGGDGHCPGGYIRTAGRGKDGAAVPPIDAGRAQR